MHRQFSIYLNLVRFIAAGAVFLSHTPDFSGGWGWQLAGFGHEAVVVFFVLSGFVISYVVSERKESVANYTVSRLARMYSVALPALFLTVILYYLGLYFNSDAFDGLSNKLQDPIWTFFSALFFVNQSWIATPVFSNLPYWSLGYEVLYYVFFGILVFTRHKKRLLFLILILLIMGPSVILYLPIWLAGAFCFKWSTKTKCSFYQAVSGYIISILGIVFFSFKSIQNLINSFGHQLLGDGIYQWLLKPAEQFLSDYVLTIFVVLHLFTAFQILKQKVFFSNRIGKAIQQMSEHTFSLYLYHMPMLYFISAVMPYQKNALFNLLLVWIAVPLAIFMLSRYTENKKQHYKIFFSRLFKLKKS